VTVDTETQGRVAAVERARIALGELFGAERRLRGREHTKQLEMTLSQLRALTVLALTDQVTAGELARSADLNPASVTAMLDQLESNGIVQRHRDGSDRRVCMVSLTPTGRAIMDEKQASWQARWEQHLAMFSEAELLAGVRVMRAIVGILDDVRPSP
jgi:DNA-binding MarR family transcriptional regulator